MKSVATRAFALTTLMVALPCAVMAQPWSNEPTVPENWPAELTGPKMAAVVEKTQRLGPWEEQARWIASAHEAVWERNGWNSESDIHARQMVSAIEALPPWRMDQRFDAFCKLTAERYHLDDAQQRALRGQIVRESIGFMTRYAPTLLKSADLVLDRRANGQPLDAQTVAEMMKHVKPVLDEFNPEMDRIMDDFAAGLSEEQRETFRRDREAFEKRRDDIRNNFDRWTNGEWSPLEWGMDKDPLYAAANRPAEVHESPVAEPTTGAAPYETAWEMYVRQFITRYDLDAAQQRAAWAVLHDLQRRAAREWARQLVERPDDEPANDRPGDAAAMADEVRLRRQREAAIDALYQKLVERLDQIPTRHQRRLVDADRPAEPAESPSPDEER